MWRRLLLLQLACLGGLLPLWFWFEALADQTHPLLLQAVLYDGQETFDLDEAVAVVNSGAAPLDAGGWQIGDGGSSRAILPPASHISPGHVIWLARSGTAFQRQFGFAPDYAIDEVIPPTRQLLGSWPGYANGGDEVELLDPAGNIVDVLVYENGSTDAAGWQGEALQPYAVGSLFSTEGQILYRRADPLSGLPVADSNSAADWAQHDEPWLGRRLAYPGWDQSQFFHPAQITATAALTIAVAPDNAYAAVATEIAAAQSSLTMVGLTFENVALAEAVAAAAARGVVVDVLLEGGPAGGLSDQSRYVCQHIEAAGGACWFMVNDPDNDIFDRYRFYHAKLVLIDRRRVAVSSENWSPNSLPDDDKGDGTWGRRGVILITDAPGVVNAVAAMVSVDLDPVHHRDIHRWTAGDPIYGAPPAGYVPLTVTGGITYAVRYTAPLRLDGLLRFELIQAPENNLQPAGGLFGLLARAGAGDTILAQQLLERPHWGTADSNAGADPNLRLEGMIAAARRGATVRLLLDAHFDDPGDPLSNAATCAYVQSVAAAERLDITCRRANPAGLGIHNKMVLAKVDGRGYALVGSWNGSEMSSKGNRELALLVQSDDAYAYLAAMFWQDWPWRTFMPVVFNNYSGPPPHLLISELYYNPPGPDDAEFIELVNPTREALWLGGYRLGDAARPTDYEALVQLPDVMLPAGGTLVVATTAAGFFAEFGFTPDYELLETDPAVPNLPPVAGWGNPALIIQLGNQGDELVLLDNQGRFIAGVAYGSGMLPDLVSCPLLPGSGYVLERFPYWRQSNDCGADFRAWPFPSPGSLP